MKLLLKDHKGLEKVATRRTNGPGMNIHISNLLSDVLEPVADQMSCKWEQGSTEAVLARIDRYNRAIEKRMAEDSCREVLMEIVNRIWRGSPARSEPVENTWGTSEEGLRRQPVEKNWRRTIVLRVDRDPLDLDLGWGDLIH